MNMNCIITHQHCHYLLTEIFVSSLLVHGIFEASATDSSTLRNDIMLGYDKHSRPVQNHKEATEVSVSVYYKGMELDEERQLFTLHALCFFMWKDEQIKWDPKTYNNLSELYFSYYDLWTPDLSVYNNVDLSGIDHFSNRFTLVAFHDSWILWIPQAKFEVGCEFDLKYWPFDVHTCDIQIGSWSHDGSQITLITDKNGTAMSTDDSEDYEVHRNRQWKIIWNSINLTTFNISADTNSPPETIVVITLQILRKGSTHIAVVLMVASGIACMILLSFWLSPLANERVPLILTVMILNALYLDNVYRSISNNGKNVPLIVSYYKDSLIMVTFDLIWTVFLRYVTSSKRLSPVPLPDLISRFLNSWAATILCLKPRPNGKNDDISSNEDDEKDLVKSTNPYHEDWAWLAYLLDRFMFLLFLIVYICFLLPFSK